jgi:ankyrin repeat protein
LCSHAILEGGGDVNDRDAFHRTALLLSSRTGKFQVTQLLIKCEAEVNCTDGVGWTPLHVATFGGHINIVHMLLDHGADVKCDEYGPLDFIALRDVL